jgi:hypothetical protein
LFAAQLRVVFPFTCSRDQIKSVLFIFVFARITFIPAALLIGVWFVSQLTDESGEKVIPNPER